MKSSHFCNTILKIFLVVYMIFSIGLCLAPLKYNNSNLFLLLHLTEVIVFICIIKYRQLLKNILAKKNLKKVLFSLIIIIGILLRIAIIFINYYELTGSGDYQTFFHNASSFCESNTISNKSYLELFPYLMPYILVLGSFFKITSISYTFVIILNIILDLFIPLFLYLTFDNKNIKKATASFWLLNPINLIWCMVCSPIVIVNFGIALSVLMFSKVLKHMSSKLFIFYSLLTGIIMGISNTFRPLMTIMSIAILLYFIYIIIYNKKYIVNYILSFILITISFLGIKILSHNIMNYIIDGNISKTSGWTFYLGSNLDSNGMWFNSAETDVIFAKALTAEEIQQEFKKLAIENYKNNGINNINLFIEKLFILTGDISDFSFDTLLMTAKINNNLFLNIVRLLLHFSIDILVLLNALNVFLNFKLKSTDKYDIFYMLLYIGIITAHIFVEVSPRYYMPAMVPLTIISGISIYKLIQFK